MSRGVRVRNRSSDKNRIYGKLPGENLRIVRFRRVRKASRYCFGFYFEGIDLIAYKSVRDIGY